VSVTRAASDNNALNPYVPSVFRIRQVKDEIENTRCLTLDIQRTSRSVGFLPGQFAMLYAFGIGEAAISFSGDPGHEDDIEFTIRGSGATTKALISLEPGEALGFRGPFGNHWPVDQLIEKDVVLIAGGLGLAPLRPVILKALSDQRCRNRIILIYGARSPDLILYKEELAQWVQRGLELHVTVDYIDETWDGDVGVVTALIPYADINVNNSVVFICGPEVMMRFCASALMDIGISVKRIWLSLERNMKCAIGHCGHCQFGSYFICKNGPIFRFDEIQSNLLIKEL
jgi:NAD(P)H-flavin reductase